MDIVFGLGNFSKNHSQKPVSNFSNKYVSPKVPKKYKNTKNTFNSKILFIITCSNVFHSFMN